ncbi:MAG: alpha-glucosidase/alpha-galactosidase [Clostridiales bacterium]|nr:alpha-glucosidase/alpha-galactosidase [Clostridiales bacterium]
MKLTFIGAGSTVFAKNVLGDVVYTPEIGDAELALFDIDGRRLEDSYLMMRTLIETSGRKDVRAVKYADRLAALRGADFVVNAVQVGGYEPCTVSDFEIPKKYGLRQTIADTLGIGGIFRALRTVPVLDGFARDMEKACPNALFINYANPMAILTGYMLRYTPIKAVGLCHSVQVCAKHLLQPLGMAEFLPDCRWEIAGINHQAWLLKIEDGKGNDLYPEIKRRAREKEFTHTWDLVRYEMMLNFGYYNTESSEHTAEYVPYFIKKAHPELIERFNIPLDEYPRRCVGQIEGWAAMRKELTEAKRIEHVKSDEFAAAIVAAALTDTPARIHGNVLNEGLIDNLPREACVEVACLADRNGISPCRVGRLPEQLAALNRTNINVQLMATEAAVTRKKDAVYQAAFLDPHTAAELTMDEIKSMCDDLFEAHKAWMPAYT